jgi:hypothetical protein
MIEQNSEYRSQKFRIKKNTNTSELLNIKEIWMGAMGNQGVIVIKKNTK